MIHLVLQTDSFHARELSLESVALAILSTDPDLRRTQDVADDTGQRKTALLDKSPG